MFPYVMDPASLALDSSDASGFPSFLLIQIQVGVGGQRQLGNNNSSSRHLYFLQDPGHHSLLPVLSHLILTTTQGGGQHLQIRQLEAGKLGDFAVTWFSGALSLLVTGRMVGEAELVQPVSNRPWRGACPPVVPTFSRV